MNKLSNVLEELENKFDRLRQKVKTIQNQVRK